MESLSLLCFRMLIASAAGSVPREDVDKVETCIYLITLCSTASVMEVGGAGAVSDTGKALTFKPSAIKPVSWKLNSFTSRSCCCVPSDSVGSKMCTSHCVLWTTSCSNSAGIETGSVVAKTV